jgi:hypothetical protein
MNPGLNEIKKKNFVATYMKKVRAHQWWPVVTVNGVCNTSKVQGPRNGNFIFLNM